MDQEKEMLEAVASSALFACPFCGFENEHYEPKDQAVSCPNCGAQGPSDMAAWGFMEKERPEGYQAAWNRRSSPWCDACMEADCKVSGDGTCSMIRKYQAGAYHERQFHGIRLIIEERHRQIATKGYDSEHDDEHRLGELALAAAGYADLESFQLRTGMKKPGLGSVPRDWPFEVEAFRPSEDPMRNLVKAGALIAAEIDRLNRAAIKANADPLP